MTEADAAGRPKTVNSDAPSHRPDLRIARRNDHSGKPNTNRLFP